MQEGHYEEETILLALDNNDGDAAYFGMWACDTGKYANINRNRHTRCDAAASRTGNGAPRKKGNYCVCYTDRKKVSSGLVRILT